MVAKKVPSEPGPEPFKESMKRMRLGLSVLGLIGLGACGGRVIQDEEPGPDNSPPSTGAAAGNPAGSAGKGSSPTNPLPSKELGKCTPGFDHAQNPTRPCRWLTVSGICFDDSDAACACICPTDRDSICAHGADDGPNSMKRIRCD